MTRRTLNPLMYDLSNIPEYLFKERALASYRKDRQRIRHAQI